MGDMTNDIIEKIIDIEHKANDIVSVAEERKKQFDSEVTKEIEKLDAEYTERANAKVKQISLLENNNMSESEVRAQQYLIQKKAQLNEQYNINKQKWLENLFEQVIK